MDYEMIFVDADRLVHMLSQSLRREKLLREARVDRMIFPSKDNEEPTMDRT
jgi:hypothetical protein